MSVLPIISSFPVDSKDSTLKAEKRTCNLPTNDGGGSRAANGPETHASGSPPRDPPAAPSGGCLPEVTISAVRPGVAPPRLPCAVVQSMCSLCPFTARMLAGADGAAPIPLPRATTASMVDRLDVSPPCAPPDSSAAPPFAVVCTQFAHNVHPSLAVLPSVARSPLLSRLGGPSDASASCASYPPQVSLSSTQCGHLGSLLEYACHVPNCQQNNMIVPIGCAHGWPCTMSGPAFVPNFGASSSPCVAPPRVCRARAPRRSVAAPSAVVCAVALPPCTQSHQTHGSALVVRPCTSVPLMDSLPSVLASDLRDLALLRCCWPPSLPADAL